MILTLFLGIFILLILSHSDLSLYYAFHGLTLWYGKMVPTLLPFMILSSIVVRMGIADRMMLVLHPFIGPLFRIRRSASFCLFIGFLCGFPMGAKCAAQLYQKGEISKKEAEYLLAFCNNLSPVYMVGFALPLLCLENKILPVLLGFYGIPLIYGILLRHTIYKTIPYQKPQEINRILPQDTFWKALHGSVRDGIESITTLCGYMMLFNLLNLFVHLWDATLLPYISPVLEVTGGLSLLSDKIPVYGLIALSFGGLCCYAQTYSVICDTDLSFGDYCKHKILQTMLSAIYFLFFFPFL